MADLPLPVLLALVPAEVVHKDKATSKFTIVNTLFLMPVSSFPDVVSQIAVYIALAEVMRPTRIDLVLFDPNGDTLAQTDWMTESSDPLLVKEHALTITNVVLRHRGLHGFRVSANGEMLAERRFIVDILEGFVA